ncbi:endonuclease/exonuclease/phosphatase family protein [Candidatus Kaiserbacteria bacterium]|nr:endonuclease/exonuclease/phosphatase family protein [Candidatus Kaiserbacteria bacterium]
MSEKFSVFSWNTQGASQIEKNFNRIAPIIDRESGDIFCLQECKAARGKITQLRNCKDYERIISSNPRNHNIILSRLPVLHHEELPFPKSGGEALEPVLYADIGVRTGIVRIYNCHFGITGIGIRGRLAQLRHVAHHAENFPGPVIICGDMNTTVPAAGWKRRLVEWFHEEPDEEMHVGGRYIDSDERYIFAEEANRLGFTEAFPLLKATWSVFYTSWQFLHLKLDWFLTKNLHVINARFGNYLTDHRPMTARCQPIRASTRKSHALETPENLQFQHLTYSP